MIMKKIFLLILSTILFLSCKMGYPRYYYQKMSNNFNSNLSVIPYPLDNTKENSPIDYIMVKEKSNQKSPKILSSKIKIIGENDEIYLLKVDKKTPNLISVYEQDISIYGKFSVHIGNVKLSNGTIINLPPLFFEQKVQGFEINPILDTINIDTKEQVFQGTVEDYKKGDWKDKKKK